MLTIFRKQTVEECDHQGDTASRGFIGIVSCNRNFPCKGGSMALKPSVDVLLSPVWPLACARRVKFLSTLALRCEYVLGRKKRTPRPVRPYFMLIPFESMLSSFPVPLPTKASTQDLPATKFFLFRGTLDIDCGVLERRRKSFALHTRIQLLGL